VTPDYEPEDANNGLHAKADARKQEEMREQEEQMRIWEQERDERRRLNEIYYAESAKYEAKKNALRPAVEARIYFFRVNPWSVAYDMFSMPSDMNGLINDILTEMVGPGPVRPSTHAVPMPPCPMSRSAFFNNRQQDDDANGGGSGFPPCAPPPLVRMITTCDFPQGGRQPARSRGGARACSGGEDMFEVAEGEDSSEGSTK